MRPTWDVRTEQGYMDCYRATFRDVYRYAAMLCGADRSAAEDLVHDVYVATLKAARRGAVTEVSTGYLTTAVRHRFLDRVRSSQREERRLRLVSSTPEPEPAMMPPQLSDLPDRERAVLVLRYVDDLTMAESAAALGISVDAAESLAARALRRLRRQEARDAE
jgi:DNA-directed RNA polymerase specialized sigma24 family protein